jgi:hypothetical protein
LFLAGERWPTTLVRLPHDLAGQEAPVIVQGRGCGRSWNIASRRAGSPTQPRSSALRGAARLIALPVDRRSLRVGRQGGQSASGAWRMRSTVWLCLSATPRSRYRTASASPGPWARPTKIGAAGAAACASRRLLRARPRMTRHPRGGGSTARWPPQAYARAAQVAATGGCDWVSENSNAGLA